MNDGVVQTGFQDIELPTTDILMLVKYKTRCSLLRHYRAWSLKPRPHRPPLWSSHQSRCWSNPHHVHARGSLFKFAFCDLPRHG